MLFERPVEMLGVLESQRVGYLCDCLVCAEYQFLGQVDDFVLDVFLCRFSRLFFDEVAKIVG